MDSATCLDVMKEWFGSGLGCTAGRREFSRNRYLIKIVHTPSEVKLAYEEFKQMLSDRTTVACLFVSPISAEIDAKPTTVLEEIRRLADLMSAISPECSPEELINGGNLNKKILLRCPVTDENVLFEDFDAVAFCPQSGDESDPLYDPMMAAPISTVNINSDIYAFSMFTRDMCIQRYSKEVFEISRDQRENLFALTAANWQRLAERTITNYVNMTNVTLCPAYLDEANEYWYANHQDPAFAETRKELYKHEMPVVYTSKIITAWKRYFEHGVVPNYAEVAEPGYFVDGNTIDLEGSLNLRRDQKSVEKEQQS